MDRYEKEMGPLEEEPTPSAHPGKPLEPDELEPSPPEFQRGTQAQRQEGQEQTQHPTTQLSTLKRGRSPGRPSSGSHPTNQLDIRNR